MLTDYEGDTPLTDLSLRHGSSSYAATATTRYFGGMGRQTLDAGGGVINTRYFHGDLIDSNVLATEPGETPLAAASTAYTAFGEPVSHAASGAGVPDEPNTLGTRYQYAGAYGYKADMLTRNGPNTDLPSVTLSHVGARWYQPGIGRFVQRDPIGLQGGINVYLYCSNDPLCFVDPAGLDPPGLIADPPIRIGITNHVHWYKKGWFGQQHYSHTQTFPANASRDKGGGSGNDEAINQCINNINRDKAEGATKGMEKLDEGARAVKEGLKRGPKIIKPFRP